MTCQPTPFKFGKWKNKAKEEVARRDENHPLATLFHEVTLERII